MINIIIIHWVVQYPEGWWFNARLLYALQLITVVHLFIFHAMKVIKIILSNILSFVYADICVGDMNASVMFT